MAVCRLGNRALWRKCTYWKHPRATIWSIDSQRVGGGQRVWGMGEVSSASSNVIHKFNRTVLSPTIRTHDCSFRRQDPLTVDMARGVRRRIWCWKYNTDNINVTIELYLSSNSETYLSVFRCRLTTVFVTKYFILLKLCKKTDFPCFKTPKVPLNLFEI